MQIDFTATREKMRLVRITRWSQVKGLPDATVRRVLSGKYPHPDGPQFKAVIDAIRQDGFLVEVPDTSDISMAA